MSRVRIEVTLVWVRMKRGSIHTYKIEFQSLVQEDNCSNMALSSEGQISLVDITRSTLRNGIKEMVKCQ